MGLIIVSSVKSLKWFGIVTTVTFVCDSADGVFKDKYSLLTKVYLNVADLVCNQYVWRHE